MRQGIFIFAAILLSGFAAVSANGQMMSDGIVRDDHTVREEAVGKAVWEKLQTKQVLCADLLDDDFGALGEYYMGQMLGEVHPAMNAMMARMMGEAGEEAMHIVMGKRLSGCNTAAVFPARGLGFMPMLQMMWGGGSAPRASGSGWSSMMGNGFGGVMPYGWGGASFVFWVTTLLIWVALALAIVALWRWIQRHK